MAVSKIKIKLQGHEKFSLREGWINKGLAAVQEHPDAFTRKDATDIFGVGSNMVKSIRYWMRAFGLTNASGSDLTDVGRLVYDNDPYIEDPFTLWILHSIISKNIEDATSWYMFFNRCDANDMTKTEIEKILLRETKKYAEGMSFSEKSLSNDVDVILTMYGRNKEKTDPEDKNTSPFAQLLLLKKTEDRYTKNRPSKRILSEMVILYELALIIRKDGTSIEEIISGEKGLEKIYNMSRVMANDYLDRLDAAGYIRVDRTAGLDMVYPVIEIEPLSVIENYYRNSKR